jgi:DNA-binding transcriptional ArsR family regulator
MNISKVQHPLEDTCKLLTLIGQPARIQILLVIGAEEVCVCHMEAVLEMRQASISQHLMVLRRAGLVSARRAGRNIYYCLTKPEVLELVEQTARFLNYDPAVLQELAKRTSPNCPCAKCSPGRGTCE